MHTSTSSAKTSRGPGELILDPLQVAPSFGWDVWAIVGDRGVGKTTAAVEYLRRRIASGEAERAAIVCPGGWRNPGVHRLQSLRGRGDGMTVQPSRLCVFAPEHAMSDMHGRRFDTIVCDDISAWDSSGEICAGLVGAYAAIGPRRPWFRLVITGTGSLPTLQGAVAVTCLPTRHAN